MLLLLEYKKDQLNKQDICFRSLFNPDQFFMIPTFQGVKLLLKKHFLEKYNQWKHYFEKSKLTQAANWNRQDLYINRNRGERNGYRC